MMVIIDGGTFDGGSDFSAARGGSRVFAPSSAVDPAHTLLCWALCRSDCRWVSVAFLSRCHHPRSRIVSYLRVRASGFMDGMRKGP